MPHVFWLLLTAGNFVIQLLYFRSPGRGLFVAKRILTPLLLFSALLVSWLTSGSFPLIAGIVLAAMGLGEIGIEGSQIVEAKDGPEPDHAPWTVTAAGIIFLLVNFDLGLVLYFRHIDPVLQLSGLAVGAIGVFLMVWALLHIHDPNRENRRNIFAYGVGLMFLAGGAVVSFVSGPDHLGIAAAILTVSDSMVLWRMGARWDKEKPADRRKLLVFLILILLLYYFFIGVLIDSSAPFFPALR